MRRRVSIAMLFLNPMMFIGLGIAIAITGNHGQGNARLYVGGAIIVAGAAVLEFLYRYARRRNFWRSNFASTTHGRHARNG
jgi:hypothetical protein